MEADGLNSPRIPRIIGDRGYLGRGVVVAELVE